MQKHKRVAILYGGRSGEHEISLISAASVYAALDQARYSAMLVGVDKEGQAWLNLSDEVANANDPLKVCGPQSRPIALTELDCDIVFPVMHGT